MKLQIPQIAALASNAGFSGDDLATAVAVALAESGGDPTAYNPERAAGAAQGRGSFGLWQIYLTAHPEYTAAALVDPQTNAQAAFAVYSAAGRTFRPWSTFNNGAYSAHLDAVNQVLSPPPADTTASGDAGGGDPGTGFDPSSGTLVTLLIVGALVFWAISR